MVKTGSKPINELIRLAIIGDGTAFTALWDNYVDSLRAFVRSRMKNIDESLVSEICCYSFEKAFRHIKDYDPSKSQFFTWLSSIAWNTALDIKDRETRAYPRQQVVSLDEQTESSVSGVEVIADDMDSPLDSLIRVENKANIEKYIDALPPLYRDVARLSLIETLKYKEIAERLDLNLNTVRTRIKRAKEQIDKMRESEEN